MMKNASSVAMQIRRRLQSLRLETEYTPPSEAVLATRQEKIGDHFSQILTLLGLNLHTDSFAEAPARMAKMYLTDWFSGLNYDQFPEVVIIPNHANQRDPITLKRITVYTFCEHHFVPIEGYATILYRPDQKLIGLSGIHRVVQFFSKRPQLQETLTAQIKVALQTLLDTEDVAVMTDLSHGCIKFRGINDQNSRIQTLGLGGLFESDPNYAIRLMNGLNAN